MSLNTSNESNKTSQDGSPSVGILSKLRRMKIQEDLLIQIIKKNFYEADNSFIKYDLEYKKYLLKLKTSYADIKQLFDDIKCLTKSQETLQKLDLDEVKKDVVELEERIKTFKGFIQRELAFLKLTEQHLVKQMDEVESQNCMLKKHTRIQTKTYGDIIPSPVKNIINSPFKYPEVQQFQDFLSNSNKHGGWNEYNHNIFIKVWQKHFQNNDETLYDTERNMFINNISENVVGVRKADIISHMEWYSKYLFLKKQQQFAIEKWRAKTKPKKDVQQYVEQPSRLRNEKEKAGLSSRQDNDKEHIYNYSVTKIEQDYSSLVDKNEFLKEMDNTHNSKTLMANEVPKFRYTKSTKQWNNRCNSSTDVQFHLNNDLDNITKLGIPNWRLKLMKDDN